MESLTRLALFAFTGGLLLAGTAHADIKRGEKLHNEQCIACHAARFGNNGADIYTRKNRRIHDMNGLRKQVNRCKNNLSITWFDDDVNDVVDYLNATYYHFKKQ
jgi:mono/diheme cytochrome c family protein